MLKDKGYHPIWLGEKQSTQPCPVPDVLDFSRLPEARDLELTLAIVSQCRFTVQFWTASTRLAALVDVPFLLFESPDQIFGNGQEGYRLQLLTFGNRKMVFSDFLTVQNDSVGGVDLAKKAIEQMEVGNWNDIVGMVGEPAGVLSMIRDGSQKLGWVG
jgi:hypothetical protein